MNDVAARVSRRRSRRRADREADVIRPERDASLRLAVRLGYRQEALYEIRSYTFTQGSQRMQRRRHRNNQIAHPLIVCITGCLPLAANQLSGYDVRLLLSWTLHEKEPRVKTSRVERRRQPATGIRKGISIKIKLVML